MATTRTASAHWEGSLMEGAGQVSLESSGIGTYPVSWPSRADWFGHASADRTGHLRSRAPPA